MIRFTALCTAVLLFSVVATFFGAECAADESESIAQLQIENSSTYASDRLVGSDARLQLLVTAKSTSGQSLDWTRQSHFTSEPAGVIDISNDGLVTPIANGSVQVRASSGSNQVTTATLHVSGVGEEKNTSFPQKIVPIFTKLSCNSGGCHGKAAGQNGFRLSLLGFGPRDDFEYLVKEARGRRISVAAPDTSLLLRKAINASPHGGGARMAADSYEYRLMRRWISQGMPYGNDDEPTVTAISVFPEHRRLSMNQSQQLAVVATYSDGSIEDVTRAAVFESNDTEMADVNATGLVTLGELVGDVAVMARYQGNVTVFRADIPVPNSTAHQDDTELADTDNVLDKFVFKKLHSLGIPASPPCDDATFLRRVTLDIAGRLPSLSEVQRFEKDVSGDKRAALVDRLLQSNDYADFFARKWNTILRNKRTAATLDYRTVAFHDWIRDSIRSNQPYDEFAREIVTASGSVASNPPVGWFNQVSDANERIEDISQLFLGQRIQCARCHHHPYEKWSQRDYTQLSAFFSTVQKKNNTEASESTFASRIGSPSGRHPKTGQSLKPAALDGSELDVSATDDPRQHFADWMVKPDNPFFAKSVANRYWKHFMGRGLVEPIDDMRVTNPPSNPELLDALASELVTSGYDLKQLIRLICLSRTYATHSDALSDNLNDRRSYSRFYPKRLQAEVLLDSVDQVTLSKTHFASMPRTTRAIALPDTQFDSYFLNVFGQPKSVSACECERTSEANLAQSLHLLNSEEMQKKLSYDSGRAAAMAADKSNSDESHVRDLYLIALSRPPSESELKATLTYLAAKSNRREAYEDLIWSIVNSKEFLFNH